ncbi:MAG: succinylglutamate desuccinylase/aspartoacylase family protein, partial [Halobaculum sp.]
MRIYDLGDGEPEYSVVACLHGDETCGLRAVEHLRRRRDELREPLRLVVANERAVDAGVRAVDTDLNRAFPGDPDGETHEERLAVEVLDAVLDLHSTVSSEEPFTIVVDATERALDLAAASGTDHVVDASYVGGGLLSHVDGVAVECGLKQTNAAAGNAVRIVARFLDTAGVIDGAENLLTEDLPAATPGHELPARTPAEPPTVYRIDGEVGERGDEFDGEN